MSNFEFLKNEYPELAELGVIAEELIDTDAASCLTKLRLITEFIAKDIYFKYFQEKPHYETQIDLLKELEPYIDSKYMDVFHIIRKKYLAGVFYMKRTRSLQKFAAQFGYEHKNRSNPFSGIKKHANELSKLLDSMFPKDKNDKEKS